MNKVAAFFACRMGPSRKIKRLCCVTGSKSKRKHSNAQDTPPFPSPSSFCKVFTICCPSFQKLVDTESAFPGSALQVGTAGWKAEIKKKKGKNANPFMPFRHQKLVKPLLLKCLPSPQGKEKEGILWMSKLLPTDPLLQSYSFLS